MMNATEIESAYLLLDQHMAAKQLVEGIELADRLHNAIDHDTVIPKAFSDYVRIRDGEILHVAFKGWCRFAKRKMQEQLEIDLG